MIAESTSPMIRPEQRVRGFDQEAVHILFIAMITRVQHTQAWKTGRSLDKVDRMIFVLRNGKDQPVLKELGGELGSESKYRR